MSWHRSYPSKPAFDANSPAFESGESPADQLHEARAAAEAIISSGAVGDSTRDFNIEIYGHSNPGHAPSPGSANDCLTISISQKTS